MNFIKLFIAFVFGASTCYLIFGNLHGQAVEDLPSKVEQLILENTAPFEDLTEQSTKTQDSKSIAMKEDPQTIEVLVNSFLPASSPLEIETYEGLIERVSAENAGRYENLNHDFFNAFAFSNERELSIALANGFPLPEELEFVYSHEIDDILKLIDERREQYQYTDPEFNQTVKLGVLTFNRAMDEFIEVLRQYRPDYQVGDPLPEMQQLLKGGLPADLELATNRMMTLQGKAAGNIAASYLAAARFSDINLYTAEPEYVNLQKLTNLAVAEVKLKTERISSRLWSRPVDIPSEFINISAVLPFVDWPSASCSINPN
ncbi:MAG: hypothetical protein GW763_12920 [Paraglaciecola sp.]|nr:hypothetical protein [Paraglaciecola sp.]NCT48860.1 hypothetical protein [Paraglaciecola sp.]